LKSKKLKVEIVSAPIPHQSRLRFVPIGAIRVSFDARVGLLIEAL